MWFSRIRSVSYSNLLKTNQFYCFDSISALASFPPSLIDEQNTNTNNTTFVKDNANKGFKHDFETYLAIVKVLSSWGRDVKLDTVLLEVINSKKEDLGFEISDLFAALEEGSDVEGPEALVRALNVLVKAYASVGMFDEAIETLFKMRRRGFGICLLSCNYLMNQLVNSGKMDIAVDVFSQLKGLGLEPNVYTYNIAMRAIIVKKAA
ncbi:hypothetical protein Leryth_009764 [Lithospermum erythrorhizon]|nr:hypothetical protein Leryth_009764 [Lithospermum erythrorhizon]